MIIPVPRRRQYFDVERWRQDGFPSSEDAESWGHRACGLACVAMLIEHYTGQRPTLSGLLWEGLRRDAYCPQGWLHAGLAGLLDERGVASAPMPLSYPDVLASVVLGGTPVIASVSDEFPVDGRRGGHLVVVTGVAVESGGVSTVFFNDPSEWGDSHDRVPGDRFAASFSGRVVVPGTPTVKEPTVSDPRASVATPRDS
jgi:hypothetical protein